MSTEPLSLAAVDLGSNSFHMVIARASEGALHVVDRLKEPVRLASGLGDDGSLDDAAVERATRCLERFGERLRHLGDSQVRAVGTNTLRKARKGRALIARLSTALGHPIEIIGGREEARLVYLGVSHSIADDAGKRLVVDIGGGSTECIIGEHYVPLQRDSLFMGCVSFTKRFFPAGVLSRAHFREARTAAQLELQSIEQRYKELGWQRALGSSGTINAIEQIVRANGWSDQGITAASLKKLRKALVAAERIENIALGGLTSDRAPVIAGGLAILSAIFDSLSVERMTASEGALREGVIYDLLGRLRHEDLREQTIQHLCERYSVDVGQAARVEHTALSLLDQLAEPWQLVGDSQRSMLRWAARLHEIGLAISHAGFHKHGAYLLLHTDMPGFSRDGRQFLAALVRRHRRKMSRTEFEQLPDAWVQPAIKLCIILRLAVLLNRSRKPSECPVPDAMQKKTKLVLRFAEGWLDDNPLTRADLADEAESLRTVGMKLVCTS